MNSTDIVGYAFDGAEYHVECISTELRAQMNGSCAANNCDSRDENNLCDQNCHGYGPNPVFCGDGVGDTCDVCLEYIEESDDEQEEWNVGTDEPQEEDYYLSDDERSIAYLGKKIVGPVPVDAEPCPRDAVMAALREYMKAEESDGGGGYYPNVWQISDHGNPTLISVLDCGCYFTEHDGDASKCERKGERS